MTEKLEQLLTSEIVADTEFNCRGVFTDFEVADLVESIKLHGLQQPIKVRGLLPTEILKYGADKKYFLLMGYRRIRAFEVAQIPRIPAIVTDDAIDNEQAMVLNITENIQRRDLTLYQEAMAVAKFRSRGRQVAAALLGMSEGWVQSRFMILDLPTDIQEEIKTGTYTHQEVRDLYSVYSSSGQTKCIEVAKKIKDLKQRGKKVPKIVASTNRAPNKGDIRKVVGHMLDNLGASLATRALAWATGSITTTEFYNDCSEYAKIHGKRWENPVEESLEEQAVGNKPIAKQAAEADGAEISN